MCCICVCYDSLIKYRLLCVKCPKCDQPSCRTDGQGCWYLIDKRTGHPTICRRCLHRWSCVMSEDSEEKSDLFVGNGNFLEPYNNSGTVFNGKVNALHQPLVACHAHCERGAPFVGMCDVRGKLCQKIWFNEELICLFCCHMSECYILIRGRYKELSSTCFKYAVFLFVL